MKKSLDGLQNNKCDYKMNDITTTQVQIKMQIKTRAIKHIINNNLFKINGCESNI